MKRNYNLTGMNIYRANFKLENSDVSLVRIVIARSILEASKAISLYGVKGFSIYEIENDASIAVLGDTENKLNPLPCEYQLDN